MMRVISSNFCFESNQGGVVPCNKSKSGMITKFLFLLLGILMIGGSERASAQAANQGWCAAYGPSGNTCIFYGSAEAACQADRIAFNKDASDRGINQTGNWSVVACDWCKYNSDGYGCYGTAPPTVVFMCPAGTDRVPPGKCLDSGTPQDPPPGCDNSAGQSFPTTSRPIVIATGSKYYTYNDFISAGNRINLTRVYTNLRAAGSQYIRALGFDQNWQYDFQAELTLPGDIRERSYSLHLANGFVANFRLDSNNNYVPADSKSARYQISLLSSDPGTDVGYFGNNKSRWKIIDPSATTWIFESFSSDFAQNGQVNFRQARPVSLTKLSGQKMTLTYTAQGELQSIQDDFTNTISFAWYYQIRSDTTNVNSKYNVPVAVKSASLPGGSTITYTYGSVDSDTPARPDRLIKFERRDVGGTVVDSQSYSYDDTRWPFYITKITDNRGIAASIVSYDDKGRAITSGAAGGLDQSTVSYGTAQSDGTITRTVTNALGKQTVYNYRQSGGTWRYESSTGVASTSCPASVTSQTYDSNSFVISEADEEGRKTTYVRDGLGRPTSITRGAQ